MKAGATPLSDTTREYMKKQSVKNFDKVYEPLKAKAMGHTNVPQPGVPQEDK